jgi:hypothetical protein
MWTALHEITSSDVVKEEMRRCKLRAVLAG